MRLGYIHCGVWIGHPLEYRAIERSANILGDPSVHLKHRLNEQVIEETTSKLCVTDVEVQVARVDGKTVHGECATPVQEPLEICPFSSS